MRYLKLSLSALAVVALVGVPEAYAQGAAMAQETILTFSNPVQVPGMVLPAGRYMFRLAQPTNSQQMVEIWNADQTKLYETTITVPVKRPENTASDIQVTLVGTGPGNVPAIQSWFHPDNMTGHMFVYPRAQARMIAEAAETTVLTSNADPDRPETLQMARVYRVDRHGNREPYRPLMISNAPTENATDMGPQPMSDTRRAEVHLEEADNLVMAALKASRAKAVGTSGTRTADSRTVTLPREELQQIRMHVQEAIKALDLGAGR